MQDSDVPVAYPLTSSVKVVIWSKSQKIETAWFPDKVTCIYSKLFYFCYTTETLNNMLSMSLVIQTKNNVQQVALGRLNTTIETISWKKQSVKMLKFFIDLWILPYSAILKLVFYKSPWIWSNMYNHIDVKLYQT